MHVTDLMIEKALLRLLDAMSQEGVPIMPILMRAVADGIVADPSNGVTDLNKATELVEWYVNSLLNIGSK